MASKLIFARIRASATQFRDKLGMPMDKEIIDVVAALRLHGFETFASCAGHVERNTGGPYIMFESVELRKLEEAYRELENKADERAKAYRVKFAIAAAEQNKPLFALLSDFYRQHPLDYENCLHVRKIGRTCGRLELNSSEYFCLYDHSEKEMWLERARAEMNEFCSFLIKVSAPSV